MIKLTTYERTVILMVVTIAVLSVSTCFRVPTWKSDRTLWLDAVAKSPCSSRAHWNLAQSYDEGSLERLVEIQKTALLAMNEVPECR